MDTSDDIKCERVSSRKWRSSSSTSLAADSGCAESSPGSSVDNEHFMSPPVVLERCATDSPSHYFLRGPNRWSSTPLLKVASYQRSVSIPVTTPLLITSLSPPKASSTPDAINLQDKKPGCVDGSTENVSKISSFLTFDSTHQISSLTTFDSTHSLSKITRTPEKQVSSLVQLGSEEFQRRIDNLDKTDLIESSTHFSAKECDSGIGTSRTSDDDISFSGVKQPQHQQTKLRRSPRHISNRLDRCSRMKLEQSPRLKAKRTYMVVPSGSHLGASRLDVIQLLAERGMWHVLEIIFTYTRPKDLCSFTLVSSAWKKALEGRPLHDQRRRVYVKEKRINRENFGHEVVKTRSSSRVVMQEVNRNFSPNTKRDRTENIISGNPAPIISPSKIRSRLFPGSCESSEKLIHCPSCSSSSSIVVTKEEGGISQERATCSSRTCGIVFCGKCQYSEHPGKPCRYTHNKSKSCAVSSKKSKARLRRL